MVEEAECVVGHLGDGVRGRWQRAGWDAPVVEEDDAVPGGRQRGSEPTANAAAG